MAAITVVTGYLSSLLKYVEALAAH